MKARICVDYLSYNWTFSEISLAYKEVNKQQSKLSFKQITRKCSSSEKLKLKNEQNHLVRYQNAIWRQMSIRRKIDPSIIDWQKECDITWLYGPLYLSHDSQTQQASSSSSASTTSLKPALKKHTPTQSFLTSRLPYDSRSEPGKLITVRFHPTISQVEYIAEAPPIITKGSITTTTIKQQDDDVQMTQSVTSAIKVILLDKITMMSSQSTSIRVCASIIWCLAWFIYQTFYFLSWSQRQLVNNISNTVSCESYR
ncbi:hypothetical protein K501DRAFT_330015 [Backusella circina FSU 941]|nr:hypothetical protein K501DRAFT_330015 [Backusella circina FSU 941]